MLAVVGGALAWMKSDIRDLRTETRADIQNLRAETRAEMQELRTEVRTEMQDLRAELRSVNAKVDALTQAILASALVRDPVAATSETAAPLPAADPQPTPAG